MLSMKSVGAILIICGCSWFGFSIAYAHRYKVTTLRRLISVLDFMECELHYRLTPLPILCRQAASESVGIIREVFLALAEELENQLAPDCSACLNVVLDRFYTLPDVVKTGLISLGQTMGKFDLEGQVQGIINVRAECRRALDVLTSGQEARLRSYQTLGVCSGAALVILFI